MFGLTKPRMQILGQELAGKIEAIGKNVNRFKPGDKVFAASLDFGAYAEYKCLPEDGPIAIMPANLSYDEASGIPTGGYNALHFLRKASIRDGQTVLINGAGGSIGSMAIQLAKYFGAEVTAVDSTEKLDFLRTIGADHVIDYTREDFTSAGDTYDIIFDVVGKSSFSRCVESLKPDGFYLLGNPRFLPILRALWTSKTSDKTVVFAFADPHREDLDFLRGLVEAGHIRVVIDKTYLLQQAAESHVYVEAGHRKGSIVLTMAHGD